MICMYYREFKILGVEGSNSVPEQIQRLEKFMNIITKTRNTGNVVILGDFNVNLREDEENLNMPNSNLKNIVLDTLPAEGFTQIVSRY